MFTSKLCIKKCFHFALLQHSFKGQNIFCTQVILVHRQVHCFFLEMQNVKPFNFQIALPLILLQGKFVTPFIYNILVQFSSLNSIIELINIIVL